MHYRLLTTCAFITTMTLAAGCGTMPKDRAISGAGIGASAGAIIGAVTGVSVVEAAVLGALGGGLTGALTNNSQINVGDPAWKKTAHQSAPAPAAAPVTATAASREVHRSISDLQARLAARGYNPGPVDGVVGAQTRAAIRAYQHDRSLPVDGQISQALLSSLSS